jgi:NAD(P)-dependent dehydrogenase (short-subunit alcohol dehydrogenase family)
MYPIYRYIGKETICRDVPVTFPPQHQEHMPGLEYLMVPRPISENPDYCGSGKLNGKTAIITGGDSGIGRAVAYAFTKEGADVAITYLYEQKDAEETKERVEELGGHCLLIKGDLTREEMAIEAVRRTVEVYGKIDILVNNQGVQFEQTSILDISAEQMELTFRTNIFACFYMTKAVLPYMARGSSIINTASITAYQGAPKLLDYSATKGAVVSFTRSLSLSLEECGIRVNAVAPGPVWTSLIPASFTAEEVQMFGTHASKVPMMRAGQPFEIAPSFVFLASDDSAFMSGQVLHPNGGAITDT